MPLYTFGRKWSDTHAGHKNATLLCYHNFGKYSQILMQRERNRSITTDTLNEMHDLNNNFF